MVSSPTEYSTREVPMAPMSLSDTNSASHPVPTGYPNRLVLSSPVLTGTGAFLLSRTMITVAETIENDDAYSRFLHFMVVNSRK